MTSRAAETALSLLAIAFAGYFFLDERDHPSDSRYVSTLLVVAIIVLALILLGRIVRNRRNARSTESEERPMTMADAVKLGVVAVFSVVLSLTIRPLGLGLAVPGGIVALYFAAAEEIKPFTAGLMAVIGMVFAYLGAEFLFPSLFLFP